MPVLTVNELVKELIEDSGVDTPVRLAQADREDATPYVLYQVSDGSIDRHLTGSSGLEFWRYTVVFISEDPAEAETLSRTFQTYIDSLEVNETIDTFVIQSAHCDEVSDEDRPELVSDKFVYFYTKLLTLAIGRTA